MNLKEVASHFLIVPTEVLLLQVLDFVVAKGTEDIKERSIRWDAPPVEYARFMTYMASDAICVAEICSHYFACRAPVQHSSDHQVRVTNLVQAIQLGIAEKNFLVTEIFQRDVRSVLWRLSCRVVKAQAEDSARTMQLLTFCVQALAFVSMYSTNDRKQNPPLCDALTGKRKIDWEPQDMRCLTLPKLAGDSLPLRN